MPRSVLVLCLLVWGCWARPTRRGVHTKERPGGMLLDQHGGGDYRVDDAAYIDDYPDVLRDYDYQVTPQRKPGDTEGDDYSEGGEEIGVVPHHSTVPPPPPHVDPVATRKPKRYQNGTLYDDYVAQCAGLMNGAGRMRAHPAYPLLAAFTVALAVAYALLEKVCDYGSRNVWPQNPSAATRLYSIPDDFPRIPRPYLQHNLAARLSLHHVIPHWLLKRFYNQVLRRNVNKEVNTLGNLLTRVLYAAYRANHMLLETYEELFIKALWFAKHMQSYDARATGPNLGVQNKSDFGEGWCVAITYYTWLPGDLFFGPSPFIRNDDPEYNFDTKAVNIMQTDQYEILWKLYLIMKRFVTYMPRNLRPEQEPSQEFNNIIYLLDKVIDYRILYLYDPHDWSVSVVNKFARGTE